MLRNESVTFGLATHKICGNNGIVQLCLINEILFITKDIIFSHKILFFHNTYKLSLMNIFFTEYHIWIKKLSLYSNNSINTTFLSIFYNRG